MPPSAALPRPVAFVVALFIFGAFGTAAFSSVRPPVAPKPSREDQLPLTAKAGERGARATATLDRAAASSRRPTRASCLDVGWVWGELFPPRKKTMV